MSKRKPLTAAKLIKALDKICEDNFVDTDHVIVMYRRTRDSDPMPVTIAEEDLFEGNCNCTLESIMLLNDPRDL